MAAPELTEKTGMHWAAMEERGVLWGMRFLVGVYLFFGRWPFRVFLYPVVGYYFIVNSRARAASLDYLKHLAEFAPELGLTNCFRHSYRHFLYFAENLLDKIIVWLGRFDRSHLRFDKTELLALFERGEGALVVASHLGNLEICRALADFQQRVRLNILVHTKHTEKFNRLLSSVDKASHVTLIQVTEINPAIAIQLFEKVQRGEFVVLVGDRIPVGSPQRTVTLPFMGKPARFPQGPYLLAHLLKCPVYTLFCFRKEDGCYHIHFEKLLDQVRLPSNRSLRRQAVEQYARPYVKRLEAYCLQAPLQWFNFYCFWEEDGSE
ncbi:MAG: lipid A biosynthesis acyltransferase [Methylothermaceae bacteria B42]|nr:MAG: lipid A biosynthesis acyltransferase [Methylothermaceae bacteria B42]HHJ40464.1 lipid A biosynthesis acyltransferase [Methylothermaceae bacterium]